MWRIVWFFAGSCRVRITGASPQWALGRLSDARIAFQNIVRIDDFTIELTILSRDAAQAQAACARAMCDMEVGKRFGFAYTFGGLLRRPLLLILLFLAAAAAVIVPKFVFFYTVVGNERVPTEKILRELEEIGVSVGTYGPNIKPQAVKNQLLCRIPELKWVTVQQNGMRAVVVVREREPQELIYERKTPRNVVAARSGVLTRVSVLEGNALCKPGDAVQTGQLLVSAYTDLGYKTQVSSALAEIYAQTLHKSRTVTPQTVLEKVPTGKTQKQVSIRIGQRRFCLFGADSGGADVDKSTIYHQFQLPGGMILPIGIEITTISDYDTVEQEVEQEQAQRLLLAHAKTNCEQDMIAGRILSEKAVYDGHGGVYTQYASFSCEEMIARTKDAALFEDE